MTPESTHRKVDLRHLAFYRAWLQGMDVRAAAARYLGDDVDLREAKTALGWIRDALVRAARRHGRLDYARLFRIHIQSQADGGNAAPSSGIPTFEEFNEERNGNGFYTQAELMEIYLEEYPEAAAATPKEKRAKRLIERQLEAIQWAESHLATAPIPSDSVVEWFDSPMAARFIMAEIRSLADLMNRIRSKGYRWWAGIRQLGQVQGGRIVKWLGQHESTLGPIGSQALAPIRKQDVESLVRPAATDILPLESFLPPLSLDGSQGENRVPARCRIQAQNDHQAILAWLSARARNENTKRSYRREAERLILWSTLERGKALSSLDIEDGTAYRDWLAALGRTKPEEWPWKIPQNKWIGRRHIHRWSPDWRPFEGTLNLRSQQQAYTILKSMFEWLTKVRYLDSNPWDGVARPALEAADAAAPDLEMTHALTRGQWAFLTEYLAGLPLDDRTARLRFVLPFAYATGLRLSELVDARTGRLYSKSMKDGLGVRWMLKVLGKGQRWRAVPMPSSVMDALKDYLAWRGLPAAAECQPDTPLIVSLRPGATDPLDQNTLYKALKGFFEEAAWELRDRGHRDDADKIAQASTHWLRHTRGSHSAENMPLNLVQRLLGHASLTTTSIYTSADDEALYEAMEKEVSGN